MWSPPGKNLKRTQLSKTCPPPFFSLSKHAFLGNAFWTPPLRSILYIRAYMLHMLKVGHVAAAPGRLACPSHNARSRNFLNLTSNPGVRPRIRFLDLPPPLPINFVHGHFFQLISLYIWCYGNASTRNRTKKNGNGPQINFLRRFCFFKNFRKFLKSNF